MLATNAFAADFYITVYTGDGPLDELDSAYPSADVMLSTDTDKVVLNNDTVKAELDLTSRDITGWKVWNNLSGCVEGPAAEYALDEEIPVSDIENKVVEPIYAPTSKEYTFLVVKYEGLEPDLDAVGENFANVKAFTHDFAGGEDFDVGNADVKAWADITCTYECKGFNIYPAENDGQGGYTITANGVNVNADARLSYDMLVDNFGAHSEILVYPLPK